MKSKPFSQDKKNLLLFTDIAGARYTKISNNITPL